MIYYIVYVSIWYVWSIWHFDAFRSHMLQQGQWSHWSMPEILLGYSSTNSVFALYLQALLLRAGFWGQRRHSSSVFHVIFTEHSAGVFFICSQIVSDPQMALSRPGLANANQMVETGAPKSILGHRSHKMIQHVPCHIIDCKHKNWQSHLWLEFENDAGDCAQIRQGTCSFLMRSWLGKRRDT
jgi:hypothetical protein